MWDGEHILFTQIRKNRILRYDPKTNEITVWREGTNRTNGLAFDENGRLFGCCSGGRAIVRFDPDGKNVVIADRLDGKKLNTPNDLAIDRKGRIWFTNPVNEGNWDKTEVEELDHRSVLRADPQKDGRYTVTRVTFDTTQPNGILVSQDQRTLYVAESGYQRRHTAAAARLSDQGRRQPRHVRRALHLGRGCARPASRHRRHVPRRRRQHRRHRRLLRERLGADDLRVLADAAACWKRIPVAATGPTNVCFGGPDLTTVFVTSTNGHFFKAQTDRVGWAMYP